VPKGGKVREVPLGNEVIAALKTHRHLRGPYVFTDDAGQRLTHSKVKRDAVRLLDSLPEVQSSPAVEQAWSKGVEK